MIPRKNYILGVSRHFPIYHPRIGEPTHFVEKILSGEKIHTVRENYRYWKARFDSIVNDDAGVLCLKHWTDKPFRSPRASIKDLIKSDGIGMQRLRLDIDFVHDKKVASIFVDDRLLHAVDLKKFVRNDGFEDNQEDMFDWFKWKPMTEAALIHFTKFRY